MHSKLIYMIANLYILNQLAVGWNYREQNDWPRVDSTCAGTGGHQQSPINIDNTRIRINPDLSLNVESYNSNKTHVLIHNTGHSVQVEFIKRDSEISIRGSALGSENTYLFENLHFHWGNDNFNGTEHSVDNVFGSAEIHFVHFNKKYGNFSSARARKDGIVVIAVLLKLSKEDNSALAPLMRVLPKIRSYDSASTVRNFNFGELLPRDRHAFYKYLGSKTTPPCSPVTFIIFADTLDISPFQVSQFRRLFANSRKNQRIITNTRHIQKTNERIVEFSVTDRRRFLYFHSE